MGSADKVAISSITDISAAGVDACIELLRGWQGLTCWAVRDGFRDQASKMPDISDAVDSVVGLYRDEQLSVARIADGELGLMAGTFEPNAGYQTKSESLKQALREVARCDKPLCKVAFPKIFFYRQEPDFDGGVFGDTVFVPQAHAGDYFRFVVPGYKYFDASMSVLRSHFPRIGTRIAVAYYEVVKEILKGRDLLLVSGDTRSLLYERNLLSDASPKSVTFLSVPSREAWNYHDDIKREILRINHDGKRVVCLACGPTASVLSYELCDQMRCLDLGHIFGDYNLALGGAGIGAFWG